MNMIVEILGWIASILIVGSYGLNISGKLAASSKIYVSANIIGGIFFCNKYLLSSGIPFYVGKYYLGNYCLSNAYQKR